MKIVEAWAVCKNMGDEIRRENNWYLIGHDKHETAKGIPRNDCIGKCLVIVGQSSIDELNRALAYWEKRNVKGSKERL